MSPSDERNWTAQIVISFEHMGLKPFGQQLEYELRRVLARVDDPRDVKKYLQFLTAASKAYNIGQPVMVADVPRAELGGRLNQDQRARAETKKA